MLLAKPTAAPTQSRRAHNGFSPKLSQPARAALQWQSPIQLTGKHRPRLAWHRATLFVSKA